MSGSPSRPAAPGAEPPHPLNTVAAPASDPTAPARHARPDLGLAPNFDPVLLSRVEDAGLNASAPPQQRWMDGWLLRLSPGKAKRARCVNAVAAGRLPLADKLRWAQAAFDEAGLPMVVRITPFSQPTTLDAQLAALGHTVIDDTRVMVALNIGGAAPLADEPRLPPRCRFESLGHQAFAMKVGDLRGSPLAQRQAHAHRLEQSPVPYSAFVIVRDSQVLACGQFAIENDLVGLYDVFVAPPARGHGLATLLCRCMLREALRLGATHAYLQVEGDNAAARAVYAKLGFVDAYRYHYRALPQAAAAA